MIESLKPMGFKKSAAWMKGALVFWIFLALLPIRSDAIETEKKVVTLAADQVIDEDYFASGEVVEIFGTVHGDVYAAGGEVRIGGAIHGDLMAAGGKVHLSGKVGQDARVAGGEVTIGGEIGRNLTVAGGEILLAERAQIHGNVISAGDLTVSSRIDGTLRAFGGNLRLTPNAAVAGDFTYISHDEADVEKGAKISGQVRQQRPPRMIDFSLGAMAGLFLGMMLLMKVVSFISTLILGIMLIALFPRFSREVVSTLRQKPIASLGWGFVVMITVPILSIALLFTLIGIPLAFILLPLYLIGLYLARLAFILWAGTALLDRIGKKGHEGWALLVGLLIYSVLTLIPGPGGMISLLVIMLGLGAALLTVKGSHAAT